MPRISPSLYRAARALHPHVAQLLPVCRDLRSAQNELRWINERVRASPHGELLNGVRLTVPRLVRRRAQGEPLQYLLGSEYFGSLELKCRPGVLIPRPETAASITLLVELIAARLAQQSPPKKLRVLDMCTGTGCIPLLFHNEFYERPNHRDVTLEIEGFDMSGSAINLAYENKGLQLDIADQTVRTKSNHLRPRRHDSLQAMSFIQADIFPTQSARVKPRPNTTSHGQRSELRTPTLEELPGFGTDRTLRCDVLISNPPYISPSDYRRTTAKSVRKFEPKLALVPSRPSTEDKSMSNNDQGDLFYPRLLELAQSLSAKLMLFEVADMEQAKRVVAMALQSPDWNIDVEIWRDEPSRKVMDETLVDGKTVNILGTGNGRSVFIWRRDCDTLGI